MKLIYAYIYHSGHKLPKRDKLGIHSQIEQLTLKVISDTIMASLSPRDKKFIILEQTRVSLEVLKHLVRIEYELRIIQQKTYLHTEKLLIEISKMTNGWIKYLS